MEVFLSGHTRRVDEADGLALAVAVGWCYKKNCDGSGRVEERVWEQRQRLLLQVWVLAL